MTSDADLPRLSSLDDPTRRALFDYVAAQGAPVSRDVAAEAVGVDRSVAAYHLDRLVADGLVTTSYFRPHGRGGPGAGRPAKHYEPSGEEIVVSVPPRDYRLAAELLARAADADPDPQSPVRAALESAARELGRELADRELEGPRLGESGEVGGPGEAGEAEESQGEERRGQAALCHVLAHLGFRPYRDAEGTTRLRNCPFSRLADAHPGLTCGMNLALVSGIAEGTAADVQPTLDPAAGDCCVAFRQADPS